MAHSCCSIWHLKIRGVQESDSGCYACQINTSPMKSQFGCIGVGERLGETHVLKWSNLLFTVGTTTSTTRGPFSRYTQRSRIPFLWDRRTTSRYSPRIIYMPTTTETSLSSTYSLKTEEAASGKNRAIWGKRTLNNQLPNSRLSAEVQVQGALCGHLNHV